MTHVLWIGAGGFIGSIARYALGSFVQGSMASGRFPYGTLAVNVIGCFAIGILSELVEEPTTRAFWIVGVLGGFTTFSAFGNETIDLLHGPDPWLAGVYVGASVGFGVAVVALGRAVAAFS